MSVWQQWNMKAAQPWELDNIIHAGAAAVDEYRNVMLPLLVKTVDASVDNDCGAISLSICKAIAQIKPRHFVAWRLQTGRDKSSTREQPVFAHYAVGIGTKARPFPFASVWDPIKQCFIWMEQENCRVGAYYRWQPEVWKNSKSVHYNGVAGEAIRYEPGDWAGKGRFTWW